MENGKITIDAILYVFGAKESYCKVSFVIRGKIWPPSTIGNFELIL